METCDSVAGRHRLRGASRGGRFGRLGAELPKEVVERDRNVNALKTDVSVLKWMMGTMMALQLATLGIILSYDLSHMVR